MYLERINDDLVLDIHGEPVPPNVVWAEDKIAWLEEKALNYSHEELAQLISELAEEYYREFGDLMTKTMCYRLANVFLAQDLRSKTRGKSTEFLSESQLTRRKEGLGTRAKHRGREVSLRAATTVATDGRNYALPTRSFYNPE